MEGPNGELIEENSKTLFDPTSKISTVVQTSGIDATVGMIWFWEDENIFEIFHRTEDNFLSTYIEGSERLPIAAGEYRVEIYLGGISEPKQTIQFEVTEHLVEIVPPYPTPEGHIEIENVPYFEAPFTYDQTWQVEGEERQINEVKIVLLEDRELVAVVVELDSDPLALSEQELDIIGRPIAQYALENGYLDEARAISIDGEMYSLTDSIAINFVNPQEPGRGNRLLLDLKDLESD